jgi:hypothetical protein
MRHVVNTVVKVKHDRTPVPNRAEALVRHLRAVASSRLDRASVEPNAANQMVLMTEARAYFAAATTVKLFLRD